MNAASLSSVTPRGHYVYLHIRRSDRSVFYVGKGKGRRAWATTGRNKWWKYIVNKHGFLVKILTDNLKESMAFSLEKVVIAALRGIANLTNVVEGGGGICGWKHSDEAKAKISAFNKGKKLSPKALDNLSFYRRERKRSPEERLKMSLAKKGKSRPSPSEETRKKISISHIGIRPSLETLKKMSESKKGKCLGKLSPTYDHTIRIFHHIRHGIFEGTRGEFILKYKLGSSCVSDVINAKQKSVKGWRLI
jgi:hypothetical protein